MIDFSAVLILLRLVTAHIIADFMLQPRSWIIQRKELRVRAPKLYLHIGLIGLLTWLFLADWSHVGVPLFIMVTHWAIDWWKSSRPDSTFNFLFDQGLHLLMILIAWKVYTGVEIPFGAWLAGLGASPTFWIIMISYIIVIWPFGYLIAFITSGWQKQIAGGGEGGNAYEGLERAGMWIGRLERLLILTFILMQQYSAIGFLIAAKSVFRFSGKLEGNRERKHAEYILIGTLMSFALAILLGIGAQYLLGVVQG
ncbi:MAG: DUF3307 domain-containing protein [Balneolaceae bacterium]|nr:DUF3307 domain-containing protein [Balneolaceae bacterium]